MNQNVKKFECALATDNHFYKKPIKLTTCGHSICKDCFKIETAQLSIKCKLCGVINKFFFNEKIWFKTSLILNEDESASIFQMIQHTDLNLIYRASRDGFSASKFHLKCDGKSNTVTIIKNNLNYVFGGFTSAKWSSSCNYSPDSNAFIFSLRRNGISCSHKFMVTYVHRAIYNDPNYGPSFGFDIRLIDNSNVNRGSCTNFGNSYELPADLKDDANYLSGNIDDWITTEIEVYQINLK